MFVTGIAHPPERLRERNLLPSGELVYLAKCALSEYHATHVLTSLGLGWEQALAKAAIELEIPYTVAIPFPGRDADWDKEPRRMYLDLLARATEVYPVSDRCDDLALMKSHIWRVDRADLVLSLWDYDFGGMTFEVMNYALASNKPVVNLWADWSHLFNLRRKASRVAPAPHGAQVFNSKA